MTLEEFRADVDQAYSSYTADVIAASSKFAQACDDLAAKSASLSKDSQELVPSILALREKKMEAEIMAATQ